MKNDEIKIKDCNTYVISEELLDEIDHELSVVDGLYACDNRDGENLFRLNFSRLLDKINKIKHS